MYLSNLLTDYFRRSIHKIPSVMEVGKDNWCCVGAYAELFSVRHHRNGLMQLVCWEGSAKQLCDGWMAPRESNY